MRLTCPSCAATYEVPSASLRPGRRAQCAHCGTIWVPISEELGVAPPEPKSDALTTPEAQRDPLPGPALSAMDRLAAPAPRRSLVALRAAWALSVLLLVGSVAAAYAWRGRVVHAWPPSGWVLGTAGDDMPAPPAHQPPPHPVAATH